METYLKTLCVSKCLLIRDNVSYGLSYACSTRANYYFCDWLSLDLTEYDSFNLYNAKVKIFVSCL